MINTSNTKSNVKIIVGIILTLAIIGGIGIFEFLSAAKTTIYLFNSDYDAGTPITTNILIPVETETSLVNSMDNATDGKGYVTSAELPGLSGKYLSVDVKQNLPLTKAITSNTGGSPAEIKLADNKVALSVPVDNISVGGPLVQPGAFVNVYAGTTEGQQSKEELILEKVKVLDITYAQLKNDNTNAPEICGASLEVSRENSIALAKAAQFGTVRLGLVKATYQKTGNVLAETMQGVGKTTTADASTTEQE